MPNTKRGFVGVGLIIIILIILGGGAYLWSQKSTPPNTSDEGPTSVENNIITIDMQFNASEVKIREIKKLLEDQKVVQFVSYFSSDQVLEETKSNNPSYFSNPNVLQTLNESGNPFGPRLVVQITDPSQKQRLIEFVQANDASPISVIRLIK